MKKLLGLTAAFTVAAMFLSCASTGAAKEAAPEVEEEVEPVIVGAWNDDHSAYVMDLSKITSPDSDTTLTLNDDGTLDIVMNNSYAQFLIPIPYTDKEFMSSVTNCVVTVSSSVKKERKLVYKVSKDAENSWGGSGGVGGQGKNCVAFQYRDYKDEWDCTDLTSYFNGDTYSFQPFAFLKGFKAFAICNNTTPTPFDWHIESIAWCK